MSQDDLSRGICPRCGMPYSYLKRKRKGNRVYLYAVHYMGYTREGGKVRKKERECYLGPEDQYVVVTALHEKEGLVLKGLADSNRALEYLNALINYISTVEIDRDLALSLAEKFEALAKRLREYAASKS